MWIKKTGIIILGSVLTGFAANAIAHGLVEDPPARNWYCGAVTKPDEVANGVAEYPECGDAFANDSNGGYQFMSVLTHARGRAQVTPLPDYVCGFGSETFNGGATPWDQAADWPTSPMSAGRQEFLWNIQWGPHFDDTEEFRYWITKSGFQYQRNRALTWNDFENTEFCALGYDDKRPLENPNVIPLKNSAQFKTYCDVPARQGRHIIYAEWGRNQYTLERFHGCIDVVFGDGPPPTEDVVADINLNVSNFTGSGSITLDGTNSQGNDLSYVWSVSAPDDSIYSIANPNAASTTLTLNNPAAAQTVDISLMVSNSGDSSSANASFLHEPDSISMWVNLGQLTNNAQDYEAGDKLSVRTVSSSGQDSFYPAPALELNAANASANAWPLALAQAVNGQGADIAIGVLDANDQVNPVNDATANRVYATTGSDVVSAFLQVENVTPPPPEPGDCNVAVRGGNNPWWAGLDAGADSAEFELDFSASGLDLGSNIRIDSGVFQTSVSGQVITLVKPNWVSANTPGYLGLQGSNNANLANFTAPVCREK